MGRYLTVRFGQALIVLWAAFTLSFVLLQALPGDAILIKFQNPDLGLSADQIAQLRLSYGADTPVLTQYVHAVVSLLHGDFGLSVQTGVPVSDLLSENLPSTLLLALLGLIVATILAFVLAALSFLSPFSEIGRAHV